MASSSGRPSSQASRRRSTPDPRRQPADRRRSRPRAGAAVRGGGPRRRPGADSRAAPAGCPTQVGPGVRATPLAPRLRPPRGPFSLDLWNFIAGSPSWSGRRGIRGGGRRVSHGAPRPGRTRAVLARCYTRRLDALARSTQASVSVAKAINFSLPPPEASSSAASRFALASSVSPRFSLMHPRL